MDQPGAKLSTLRCQRRVQRPSDVRVQTACSRPIVFTPVAGKPATDDACGKAKVGLIRMENMDASS